jgi:glutaconate CoA-transferase subunit B
MSAVSVASEYTLQELMVIEAARRIRDGDVVFVGTGLPLLATTFAQRTHAPNLCFVVESGAIAPLVLPTPISVSDPKLMYRAARLGTLREVLGCLLQRGLVDVGFLGGAQIDQFGNINSTVIGDYRKPTVRLPGSGGGNDIASHAKRLLIVTTHEKRRFPPRCDYITSPGYLDGPDARRKAGLTVTHPGITVVTDLAVLEIDPATARFEIAGLMPGVPVEKVREHTGFELGVAPLLGSVEAPTAEQLRVLREEIDPGGVYLERD